MRLSTCMRARFMSIYMAATEGPCLEHPNLNDIGQILRTCLANSVRCFLLLRLIHDNLIKSSDTQFPAKICSMETTSTECLLEVRSLLSCPFKVAAARSLQGTEAQIFVDFLDQVSGLCGLSLKSTTEHVGHRFSSGHPLMTNSVNEVSCCFPRFAKPLVSYPQGISFEGRYSWSGFTTAVCLQT
jgi:hypothetical protein